MQQGVVMQTTTARRGVPSPLRFLGKLVLEVFPASLASVIGGFLLTHYQFGEARMPAPPIQAAGPASPDMMRLVRDEHVMIRAFVNAQTVAEKNRVAAADGKERGAAMRTPTAAPAHITISAVAPAPTLARRKAAIAAGAAVRQTLPPPLTIVRLDQHGNAPTAEPATPSRASILTTTLAIPSRMVALTVQAVAAVGAVPSWIESRFDLGGLSSAESASSPAS